MAITRCENMKAYRVFECIRFHCSRMISISTSFSIPSASQNLTTEARVSASRKWKKLLFTPWMMSLSLETFRFQMDAILAKKIKQTHWQYFVLGKNYYCLYLFLLKQSGDMYFSNIDQVTVYLCGLLFVHFVLFYLFVIQNWPIFCIYDCRYWSFSCEINIYDTD